MKDMRKVNEHREYVNDIADDCAREHSFDGLDVRAYNSCKYGFLEGYEQAEKDLALTWQDIAKIDDMLREVENCVATSDLPTMGREEYYTEVLNRYNELKRNESKN